MKVTYDSEADALYIAFVEDSKAAQTQFDDEGIGVDFDRDGRIIGIEILDANLRVPDLDTLRRVLFADITAKRTVAV